VSVRLLDSGQEIVALNPHKARRIASVSKVFTATAALQRLGEDYHFRTAFYADGRVGPSVGTLYLKGYGDPMLVSEEWQLIASALPVLEIRDAVVVDDSFFSPTLDIVLEKGVPNPYNARNAAFASNFNTIQVSVSDGKVSGEPQTPLTPFTVFTISPTRRGAFHVDTEQKDAHLMVVLRGPFDRRARSLRFHLGNDNRTPGLYAGHLFSAFFTAAGGVANARRVERGEVPADAELLYIHQSSRALSQVATELFEYSNNFIANQVFLVLGAEAAGAPADVDKALATLRADVDALGGGIGITLHEGSGLDPRNRAQASAITQYLCAAHKRQPYLHQLLVEKADGRARIKTGTYRDYGVRAAAGYLLDQEGKPFASVALLCDGRRCSRRAAQQFESLLGEFARSLDPTTHAIQTP
jgi:D-alanyl-D-alanine carboxypeptidase/D-alanyl-D-alanine-endopeptidase (penicillin-binding protein 4)